MRKLAVMPIWAREDFVSPALEQALDIVDEVAVSVVCMHEYLRKHADRSENLVREFASVEPRIRYVDVGVGGSKIWSDVMADTLNILLGALKPEDGDLVWLLDCDEFYTPEAIEEINNYIKNNPGFNSLKFASRFFFPDFNHYVTHSHIRLHRHYSGRKFVPTSYYAPIDRNAPLLLEKNPMFHYSMMVSWEYKYDFWEIEFGSSNPSKAQKAKMDWAKFIFPYFNVNKQEESIKHNKALTGHAGVWFSGNVGEAAGGQLFEYTGQHPLVIEKYNIPTRIQDSRKYFPLFKPRTSLLELVNKKDLVLAEIGVAEGHHAYGILTHLDVKKLYLIDPYIYHGNNVKKKNVENRVVYMQKLLKRWEDKIVFIRKPSSEAAVEIPDEILDAIYVDGNHTRPYVLSDLELYYPKVKPGGLVSGHDFVSGSDVEKVVVYFAEQVGIEEVVISGRNNWAMHKPLVPVEKEDFNLRAPFHELLSRSNITGVEVGVERGLHAEKLLDNLDISLLWLVDPYKSYKGRGGWFSEDKVLSWKYEAKGRLDRFVRCSKAAFLEMTSEEAAGQFEDNSLDFVYVDDNHTQEAVETSLDVWYLKVKPGGLFAGHDYYEDEPGLIQAVQEFAKKHGLELNVEDQTVKDVDRSSWWFSPGSFKIETAPVVKDVERCLIVGPFAGELGYEVMMWIPALIAMSEKYDKVIAIVPSGHAYLYPKNFEVHTHAFNPTERYKFNTRDDTAYSSGAWKADTQKQKAALACLDSLLVGLNVQHPDADHVTHGSWLINCEKKHPVYE